MALCLEKGLKFACGSSYRKGCSLWVIDKWWKRLSEINQKVITPNVDGCASLPLSFSLSLSLSLTHTHVYTRICTRICIHMVCLGWEMLFLHDLVQLGALLCIHLLFLMDEIMYKQSWNLFYAQIVPIIGINLHFQNKPDSKMTVLLRHVISSLFFNGKT